MNSKDKWKNISSSNSLPDGYQKRSHQVAKLSEYILKYGTRIDNKGKKIVNTKYIYPYCYRVVVKSSFFRNESSLLEMLFKLSFCERADLLRFAVENVVAQLINYESVVDLEGIDFLLEDDLKRMNDDDIDSKNDELDGPRFFS